MMSSLGRIHIVANHQKDQRSSSMLMSSAPLCFDRLDVGEQAWTSAAGLKAVGLRGLRSWCRSPGELSGAERAERS